MRRQTYMKAIEIVTRKDGTDVDSVIDYLCDYGILPLTWEEAELVDYSESEEGKHIDDVIKFYFELERGYIPDEVFEKLGLTADPNLKGVYWSMK